MPRAPRRDRYQPAPAIALGLSPQGRKALALGMVALLGGLASLAAGVGCLVFDGALSAITLPGPVAHDQRELIGMFLTGCGAVATLAGAMSVYKSHAM